MNARAFWVVRPGASEIRALALPAARAGEVQVETLYSAISRGTESLVYNGYVPASEYQRMRCPHQEGEFPGPVKYGYASVGRVVGGSSELVGRVVFCLYPHQTAYVVAEDVAIEVPHDVPPERAVLAANLETALNALWDAQPLVGDRISVVGAGVVGCLVAYLAARVLATDVELVDVRPERADVARALGVRFALANGASAERDLVLHASGSGEGLVTALSLAANEARVLELSWFGDRAVTLPLGQDFHVKRLTLRSSQVGQLSPNARRRFTHRKRLALALSLCADPALGALISGECAFEDLPETMQQLAAKSSGALCQRVSYG